MAWGNLRTRAGALPFSFSDLGFSDEEDFVLPLTLLGTLPLGAAVDLGFSTLAAPARSTRFAAGACSLSAARVVVRVRDSGRIALLAARARLGGMEDGGGGKRSGEGLWSGNRRNALFSAQRTQRQKLNAQTRDANREQVKHVKCT